MYTLRQYLMTLSDPDGLTRTLGEVEVCRDTAGRMCFSVGNSAVVFRIRHEGRIRSLRGYLRPQRHLREIYGKRLLEKELYLYTSPRSGVWVDAWLNVYVEEDGVITPDLCLQLQSSSAVQSNLFYRNSEWKAYPVFYIMHRSATVTETGLRCKGPDGQEMELPADQIICAAGLRPRRDETNELVNLTPEYLVVGDCKAPRQITQAMSEAYYAMRDI